MIFLISIHLLCTELYNKRIGILTILVIFSLNFYYKYYRDYTSSWKLLSILPLVFYFYVKSNKFQKIKYSILFAIATSYFLISKYYAVIYLIPLFYIIIKTAFDERHKLSENKGRNIVYVFIIIILLSFLWYFPQLNYLVRSFYFRFTTPVDEFVMSEIFTLDYHLYHINTLLPFFLGVFLPIFALILIWKLFTHKKKVERIMLMTVIISFIVFNLSPPKGDFLIHVFFIPSIFLSEYIVKVKNRFIKVAIIIIILALFVNSISHRYEKFNNPGDLLETNIGNNQKKVVEFILSDFGTTNKTLNLFILNEHWLYSIFAFEYRLFINHDKHILYFNYHLEPGYYENVTLQNRTIKGYSYVTVNNSFNLIKDGLIDYVALSFLFDDRVHKNETQKISAKSYEILDRKTLLKKYHLVKIINQDCISTIKMYCHGYYIFKNSNINNNYFS